MQDPDLLLTISEVAAAFAGFASLVTILGQRAARDDVRVSSVRMRAMVLYSLLVVAFSLLPFFFNRYGMPEIIVWRMSSLLFAIAIAAVETWLIRQVIWLGSLHLPSRRPVLFVVLPTLSSAMLLLLANATLVPSSQAAAVYLTGLGLMIFLAGFVFALILFSFLATVHSEP